MCRVDYYEDGSSRRLFGIAKSPQLRSAVGGASLSGMKCARFRKQEIQHCKLSWHSSTNSPAQNPRGGRKVF